MPLGYLPFQAHLFFGFHPRGEFFEYFNDSIYRCETRWNASFGGPILTLEDEKGLAEIFMVAVAESFDECDAKTT